MSTTRRVVIGCTAIMFLAMVPLAAWAVTITVNVDGTVLTGTDSVVVSNADGTPKSYAGYTIEAYSPSSGPAVVDLCLADNVGDCLRLKNAKIKATVADVSGHISFWAEHAPPPAGSFWFKRTGQGVMSRAAGGTPYDTVTVTGYIQVPPGTGGFNEIGSSYTKTCTFSTCTFSQSNSEQWVSLFNNRVLKGEMSFFLKSVNAYIGNSAAVLQVYSSSSP